MLDHQGVKLVFHDRVRIALTSQNQENSKKNELAIKNMIESTLMDSNLCRLCWRSVCRVIHRTIVFIRFVFVSL